MNAQEIFDKVATHLLTQGARAIRAGKCVYRGDAGRKCAAGILIDDAYYDQDFEGKGVAPPCDDDSPRSRLLNSALINSGVPQKLFGLVASLQVVHDQTEPCDWLRHLAATARSYGLSTEALDREIRQPTDAIGPGSES